jgi:hypothetical protein
MCGLCSQEVCSGHFLEVFKGERTWVVDDPESSSAGSAGDMYIKSSKPDYVMSKTTQDHVEKRMRSLLWPPGLVSGTVLRLFQHTGTLAFLFRFQDF